MPKKRTAWPPSCRRVAWLLLAGLSVAGCQGATVDQAAATDAGRWRILSHTGPVIVRRPDQPFWQTARLGEAIRPGSLIATRQGGQLTLASADDVITASDRSRLAVINGEPEHTEIRQDLGKVRYRVRSAPQRRFEVETPYMATVVKGTTFEITVSAEGAAVEVEEGRVWASSDDRRAGAELTPGQAARAASGSALIEVRRDRTGPFEPMPDVAADASLERAATAMASPGPGAVSARPDSPVSRASAPPANGSARGRTGPDHGGGHGGSRGGDHGGGHAGGQGGGHGGGHGGGKGAGHGGGHGGHGGGKGGGHGGGKGGGHGGGKGGGPSGGKGRADLPEDPGSASHLL